MRVLGLSPLDKDATASAVEDGRLVFAAGEERYSRIKQHAGFPLQAARAALAAAGWTPDDVDAVAYPFLDAAAEEALIVRAFADEAAAGAAGTTGAAASPRALAPLLMAADQRAAALARERAARASTVAGLRSAGQRIEKGPAKRLAYRLLGVGALSGAAAAASQRRWARAAIAAHRRWQDALEAGLRELGVGGPGGVPVLHRGEHHGCHAAGAYLASGFDRALVVTLNGYGSGLAGSVSLGQGGALQRLAGIPFPHSLGSFYEAVTSSLGFHPDRHAGKIVGLAAYGDPDVLSETLLARIERTPGAFRLPGNLNIFFSRHVAGRFAMVDVAAAWQRVLEVVACEFVQHWQAATGCDSLVLSGGVAANVKLNQRLHALPGVARTFIDPNMGDGGCGTGLALQLSWPRGGAGTPLHDVYLGPQYGERALETALREAGLPCERPGNLAAEVARRIHAGQVIARFDGRMEYGPRALGNRSILYHAREPGVNQWLNQRLGRTEFMPFAPVTLREAAGRCYEGLSGAEHAAEFMTITFDCTPWMRAQCPAAVHVDGTARPQLVRREVNPGYYAIVEEYARLSGIPCLINTSFNMHEEPIVCSPQDAIRAFLLGHLDGMAMGPFFVANPRPGAGADAGSGAGGR